MVYLANNNLLTWVAFCIIAFLCGSLPFSVWLGNLFLKQDVRQYGDGNPGATNVIRAGSKAVGLLVLTLDISKAAAPVGLAYHNLGIRGIPMVLIAVAPVLGHAFSPFLGFHGGKALATALGVWIGLTIWKASLVGVLGTMLGYALIPLSGWAVMIGQACILAALLIWMPDPLLLVTWGIQVLILTWTHRSDLCKRPYLRAEIKRLLHIKAQ
jgi:glycerol-3-phosphate acyltransferase PlsY